MSTSTAAKARKARRFDSLEQEVYLNLWRTYDRLRIAEDALFDRYELTSQLYNLLRLLKAQHPQSVPTLVLAGRLVSRAPDITRMLDRLERRDLVQRNRTAANRRVVAVSITPAGLTLLAEIAKPLAVCHEQQLGHLGEKQLRALCELLQLARKPHEPEGSVWAGAVKD